MPHVCEQAGGALPEGVLLRVLCGIGEKRKRAEWNNGLGSGNERGFKKGRRKQGGSFTVFLSGSEL